jgi:steroid delta-isomerase-like uncharacterized protein
MATDARAIVDSIVELWNTGNPEVARKLYNDESERMDPNEAEAVRGPQKIVDYIAQVRSAFPDFKLEVNRTVAEGDLVVALWTCTGTHKGEFLGIAPTGRQVNISGVAVNHIKNGQVMQERAYFDRLLMLQQLGAAPGATQGQSASAAQ